MEQRILFSVIQNVMQIISIQTFHDDNEVMWFLGYLKRIQFGIKYFLIIIVLKGNYLYTLQPSTDLNNSDNILVNTLEDVSLIGQHHLIFTICSFDQFDRNWSGWN